MAKKRAHISIIVMVLYTLSLAPLFSPTSNSDVTIDSAILQLQQLYSSSTSAQYDFMKSMRGSLLTLKTIAGVCTVTFQDSNKLSQNTEIQFSFLPVKSPHLLPALDSNALLNTISSLTLPNKLSLYTSIPHLPELPPPIHTT